MAESLLQLVEEFKRLERRRRALSGKLPLSEANRLENLRKILAQRLHGGGGSDRRQELRIPTSLRVRYRTEETFINNYIHNLSSGGVFISTPNPLPLDSRIKLHLVFEEENKEIVVEGKVVWENTQKHKFRDITKPGMGVKFLKMDKETRDIIENLVHNALTEQARIVEEDEKNDKKNQKEPKNKKGKNDKKKK